MLKVYSDMAVRLKVKVLAQQKGISQGKLSRMSDVSMPTIQRIYRNPVGANVSLDVLDRIARALGVDVSELIESVGD